MRWWWLWLAGCSEVSIGKLDPPVAEAEDTDTEAAPDEETDDGERPSDDTDPPAPVDDTDSVVPPVDTDPPAPPVDTDPPAPPVDTDPPAPPVDTDPPAPPVDTDPPLGMQNPCGPPIITPYYTGGPFGGFQSTPGTGYQTTINVELPCPSDVVEVTIIDPDYPANLLIGYAGGVEVGRRTFVGDGMPGPGFLTTDLQRLSAPGMTRLELVPDPIDYVAYELVVYY